LLLTGRIGERVVTKGEVVVVTASRLPPLDVPLADATDNPPVRFQVGAAVHRDQSEEVQRSNRTERSLAPLS